VIATPNFPESYPHNRECMWTIEAPRGNQVNMTFSHFQMEDHFHNNTCIYDFVEVWEAVNKRFPIGCENTAP
jgi:cubilin